MNTEPTESYVYIYIFFFSSSEYNTKVSLCASYCYCNEKKALDTSSLGYTPTICTNDGYEIEAAASEQKEICQMENENFLKILCSVKK